MIDFISVISAILLPWLLGFVVVLQVTKQQCRENLYRSIGYAYFIGAVYLALIFIGWDAIGMKFNFLGMIAFIILLICIHGLLGAQYLRTNTELKNKLTSLEITVIVLLLVLISIKMLGFFIEIINLPLFPWDAWMNWAPKAITWLHHLRLVEFVEPQQWLNQSGQTIYTLSNWTAGDYPPLVPMQQTWIALSLGHWDYSLINLPWAFCMLALLLSIYGHARAMKIPTIIVLVFCYFLVSMPLIGTHVVLSGYADIWLASYLMIAILSLLAWYHNNNRAELLFFMIFALATFLVKLPGIIWLICILTAMIWHALPKSIIKYSLFIMIGTITLVSLIHYFEFLNIKEVINQLFKYLPDAYSDIKFDLNNVFADIIQQLIVFDNWHLFWLLAIIGFITTFLIKHHDTKTSLSAKISMLFILVLFSIFLLTNRAEWAKNITTINRATIHIIPTVLFWLLLEYQRIAEYLMPQKQTYVTKK